MINLRFLTLLFLLISIVSCDDTRVFDEYKTVSDSWEKDEKISFALPELDSLQGYNLFINVRNTNDYKFSNLFLISEMEFPNGKIVTDTLEYEMAKPNGEWLGVGFTDLKESKLWYKENVNFAEKGVYKVVLQHAMRKNGETLGINSLEGITDIGFRIEFAENPK
ncbi:gliding motility lipoprotein GldH [Aquimarina sp. BL5]|uniref:gliding motility lipoprotein GldH n=1 Tax=Aquimarina sp. BL5 TaxID=1714860 RepID=UPI000E472158|nr:gliding motility lipoprotein GldH [Aquimarina sp. BL5]AXT51804.1 gliding motility lipoprotein GldH [Aquimarina sp. BL5]RKN11825.1 gliding motility lipoprotein GldH [Aquimarina sp. BL5]